MYGYVSQPTFNWSDKLRFHRKKTKTTKSSRRTLSISTVSNRFTTNNETVKIQRHIFINGMQTEPSLAIIKMDIIQLCLSLHTHTHTHAQSDTRVAKIRPDWYSFIVVLVVDVFLLLRTTGVNVCVFACARSQMCEREIVKQYSCIHQVNSTEQPLMMMMVVMMTIRVYSFEEFIYYACICTCPLLMFWFNLNSMKQTDVCAYSRTHKRSRMQSVK